MVSQTNSGGIPRAALLIVVILGAVIVGWLLANQLPGVAEPLASPSLSGTSAPSEAPLSALELLDCDGEPLAFGDLVENQGMQPQGGPTPQAVFDFWIVGGGGGIGNNWGIPINGYEEPIRDGERYLYLYRVGTEVKVVVVISPRLADEARGIDGAVGPHPFATDEVRLCDGAEYGAQADFFGDGERVWANGEGMILVDRPGPDHCGWQSAQSLNVPETLPFWGSTHSGRDYWADPDGVLPLHESLPAYDGDAELPDDATDSGYRHEDLELWFAMDERAVYVVSPDHVELWPARDLVCS